MKPQFLAGGLTLVILTACSAGAPAVTSSPSQSATPTTAPTPTATAAPTPSPSPQPTEAPPTPSPTLAGIAVYMVDAHFSYFYNPAAITVPAGDVNFVLYSATFSNHNMRIGPEAPVCTPTACTFGPVTAASAAVLAGSKPVEFTVEALAAGTYSYWCTIGNYAPLGMIGTLTVTP
jgi:plastocyanin